VAISASTINELEREFSTKAVRALAKSALRGNEVAIEILKESKHELKKWIWLPEVRELFERGII